MVRRPTLAEFPSYPITAGLALAAVGVTVAAYSGTNVNALGLDGRAFGGEPWRLVTWILPHLGILHIIFNVYWLWVFGALHEGMFGHGRLALLVVASAAMSGTAELLMRGHPFGLSGVVYALFGFFWAASRFSFNYRDTMDKNTVQFFLAWFVLCIVLTYANVWQVANAAHGVGGLVGYLMGTAITAKPKLRVGAWVLLAILAGGVGLLFVI